MELFQPAEAGSSGKLNPNGQETHVPHSGNVLEGHRAALPIEGLNSGHREKLTDTRWIQVFGSLSARRIMSTFLLRRQAAGLC